MSRSITLVGIFKHTILYQSELDTYIFKPDKIYYIHLGEDFKDSWIEDADKKTITFTHTLCSLLTNNYTEKTLTCYSSILEYLKYRKKELKGKKHGKK